MNWVILLGTIMLAFSAGYIACLIVNWKHLP